VDVLDINNGNRFTTYTIPGSTPGNGDIIVNGAAARLVHRGDLVIICAFAQMPPEDAKNWKPTVLLVNENNKPVK
jgi:aspartate 1-decarboxylase